MSQLSLFPEPIPTWKVIDSWKVKDVKGLKYDFVSVFNEKGEIIKRQIVYLSK